MFRSLLIKEIDRCPLVILSFDSSVEEEKNATVIIGARLGGPLKVVGRRDNQSSNWSADRACCSSRSLSCC